MRTIIKQLGSNMPKGVQLRILKVLWKYKLSFRSHSLKLYRIYISPRDHKLGQVSMEYSSAVNTVDCVETLAGHMGERKTTECTDHHT